MLERRFGLERSRFLKGNLLMIVMFLLSWHFSVIYKIKEYRSGGAVNFSWQEMFSWIYEPMESHLGARAIVFFFNTAFLLVLQYMLSEQSEAWSVRQGNRQRIAYKYLKIVLLEAFCFAFVCELFDCIGMWWNYPDRTYINFNFFTASLGHMACLSLWFMRTGIFLLLFRCMPMKKLAPYFVELLYVLEYLWRYQLLGIKIMPEQAFIWTPIADVTVKLDLYFHSMTSKELMIILSRNIGMICLVGFVYFAIFNKKDLVGYEKT